MCHMGFFFSTILRIDHLSLSPVFEGYGLQDMHRTNKVSTDSDFVALLWCLIPLTFHYTQSH